MPADPGLPEAMYQLRPDRFFTTEQQQRLAELMTRWRAARDRQTSFSPEEQAELESLVAAEVRASADRAAAEVGSGGEDTHA